MTKRISNAFFNQKSFKIKNNYSKSPKKLFYWSITLFTLFIVILSFFTLDSKWMEFFKDMPSLFERIGDMFKWDWTDFNLVNETGHSFLYNAFVSIWDTVVMAFAGTIIGVIIAIPIAVLASSNVTRNKSVNFIARLILSVFRTIPSFVYALILVNYFGASTFTITLSLTFFTFSISGKTLYERIEQINVKIFSTSQATGANKTVSFRAAVWPQVSHHVLSIMFYSLETNIRYVSIIAGVTRVGIGQMINNAVDYNEWNRVGFLLCLLIAIILLLELCIWLIRNYIIEDKDFRIDGKHQKRFDEQIKKINSQKTISFYINNILCVKIDEKIKNSKSEVEKKELLVQRQNMVSKFKKNLNENIKFEKANYKNLKKSNPGSFDLYSKDLETGLKFRIDKISQAKLKLEVDNAKNLKIENLKIERTKSHKEFLENLTIEKALRSEPKSYIKRIILYLIIFGFFIYTLTLINWKLSSKEMIEITNRNLLEIFKINWSSLFISKANGGNNRAPYSVMYLLYETLSIAVVGTFIGAVIAYVLGMLSSEKIVNKYVARFFIALTSMIRAIPTYIYALIFVIVVGMGPFTGVLALIMGTIGMLTKYNRELFDDINQKIIFQLEATGVNWFAKLRYGIMSQTSTAAMSNIIYRFDINFKEVAMLGAVGAGNMGYLLNSYFTDQYFNEFGALLFGIILFTLLIEFISASIRNKLSFGTNLNLISSIINFVNQRFFSTFKSNEKLLNLDAKLSYQESMSLYAYTNQTIMNNAIRIKKEEKLSFKNAWNKAYIDFYNIRKKYNNLIADSNIVKLEELKFKKYKKDFAFKRKVWVAEVKQESKMEIIKFKKLLKASTDFKVRKDLKNSIKYSKKIRKLKITNINY
ncbi:phosphonate transport system permease protein [Mesoplasma entomophilum]|uniref:Phosphonate ABC transporter permease n=1 Tax=Mesoplasma entomophilum TaxID=2149 RepID=A0A3S5Y0J0_9MOLU|nr:ABC transporter permease subunit [Mesoplasma entomophilum]ATQ35749.1 phosphonate ABC transporter permease [Mesoplasma entomophilum]ATZ19718.1 phosphonate transport system permease protein [Mesoplasma entomophilum]